MPGESSARPWTGCGWRRRCSDRALCSRRKAHDKQDHEDQAEETDSSDVIPWHADEAKPKEDDRDEGAGFEESGERGCREKIHEARMVGIYEDKGP